jgi:hypothetical protein
MVPSSTPTSTLSKQGGGPPPPLAILIAYTILGSGISFLAGRQPGTLPSNIVQEVAPSVIVICMFLVYYELWDCMAVGSAKHKFQSFSGMSYNEYCKIPSSEEVYLAQRVQTNQIEQMPVFLFGIFSCAILVNGSVAAVMGFFWCVLRIRYAYVYRNSVGMKYEQTMKGIGQYTIPAYFFSNSMCMASAIHSLRSLMH